MGRCGAEATRAIVRARSAAATCRTAEQRDHREGGEEPGASVRRGAVTGCAAGAAAVVRGRKVNSKVQGMIVPGSGVVKQQAEQEGLDRVFKEAGFDWREAGCSMCLGMNPDQLAPGERCASTSNRNFEGRQGKGGRTHLVSPTMAAAAAITGHFVDIRDWKFVD